MGFLQKLGLVKDTDESTVPDTSPPKKTVTVVSSTPPPMSIASASGTNYDSYLEDAITKANQQGLDFLEFRNAVNSLEGQPLTDAQKYILTFPTYKASGMTADKLIASAEKYKSVITAEVESFNSELAKAEREGVTAKETEAAQLQKEISDLQKTIQEKTTKMQQASMEAIQSKSKLSVEKASFDSALNAKLQDIDSHISKIKTHLSNEQVK